MHDFEFLPPAVLTVCLNLQSLPDSPELYWRDQAGNEVPRSLAQRLTWGADFWNTRPRSRPGSDDGRKADRVQFADNGLDITAAHSASDAIELLRMLRFDLVLIGGDVLGSAALPLVRRIRAIAPQTKCIVVSATMGKRREQAIREAGVLAVLDTPMPFVQLHEVASLAAARGRQLTT